MKTCSICKRKIMYRTGRGWYHSDGGGVYWLRCPKCSWQGSGYPNIVDCPTCGCKELRDDHCVLPGGISDV